MIYYRVLVNKDGFTREEEIVAKEETIPRKVCLREYEKVSVVGYRPINDWEPIKTSDKTFYFITSFFALGKNILLYKEV